jgi:hypothetical protein
LATGLASAKSAAEARLAACSLGALFVIIWLAAARATESAEHWICVCAMAM